MHFLLTTAIVMANVVNVRLQISQVFASLDSGTIMGITNWISGGFVTSFRGIPFAWPPVGELRFEPPQATFRWNGVLNATSYGPICFQKRDFSQRKEMEFLKMDENCLNLNVFIPRDHNALNGTGLSLPVIVVLHPGNFQEGSGRFIDGERLSLSLDVIVVTANFRLGVWGMLALEESDTANAGLYDQLAVLGWVNRNIQRVGGDLSNIVLMCDHFTARLHLSIKDNVNRFSRILSFDENGFHKVRLSDDHVYLHNVLGHELHGNCNDTLRSCINNVSNELLQEMTSSSSPWEIQFFPFLDNKIVYETETVGSIQNHRDVNYLLFHDEPTRLLDYGSNSVRNTENYFDHLLSAIAKAKFVRSTMEDKIIKDVLKLVYHPEKSSSFSVSSMRLHSEADWTEATQFVDTFSANHLAFVVVFENTSAKSIPERSRQFFSLQNCKIDFCSNRTLTTLELIKSFCSHGLPKYGAQDHVRPYTSSSRHHVKVDSTVVLGDKQNWPYDREELLWGTVLPSIGKTSAPCVCPVMHKTSYATREWGMADEQFNAFMLSLILCTLLFLMIIVTLSRILCYVNKKHKDKNKSQSVEISSALSPRQTAERTNSASSDKSSSSPRLYQQRHHREIFNVSAHCH